MEETGVKSPITGKEMVVKYEFRKLKFRGKSYNVVFYFYLCEDSGEQFTTTEMDEFNLNQLYGQVEGGFSPCFETT